MIIWLLWLFFYFLLKTNSNAFFLFTPCNFNWFGADIALNICSFSPLHFLQDHKLKHMAELQQSVVTDQDTRHQIQTQILQWEENLERLHCEQFRLRCYMASLQSGELPNPKVSKLILECVVIHNDSGWCKLIFSNNNSTQKLYIESSQISHLFRCPSSAFIISPAE